MKHIGTSKLFKSPRELHLHLDRILIDHVHTNEPAKITHYGVVRVGISDHGLIYAVRKYNTLKSAPKILEMRPFEMSIEIPLLKILRICLSAICSVKFLRSSLGCDFAGKPYGGFTKWRLFSQEAKFSILSFSMATCLSSFLPVSAK